MKYEKQQASGSYGRGWQKLREVLTKFLSRNDYEVLAAENGKVGLELFMKIARI